MPKFINVGMIHGSKVWLSSRILWTKASKLIYKHITDLSINLKFNSRPTSGLNVNDIELTMAFVLKHSIITWNFRSCDNHHFQFF